MCRSERLTGERPSGAPTATGHGEDAIIQAQHAPGPPLVAVITGASSGIGEAAARRIAREPGSSLVLVARRQQRLRALADALGAERASWVAVDLTDEGAPAQIAEHVRERHGRLPDPAGGARDHRDERSAWGMLSLDDRVLAVARCRRRPVRALAG